MTSEHLSPFRNIVAPLTPRALEASTTTPTTITPNPSSSSPSCSKRKGIVIFSGGSAANSLVDVFNSVAASRNCSLSYVIPISDNGGSSSELIRVFGGPGIGDVRSRLVRLIPQNSDPFSPKEDPEKQAIRTFFNYRLPSDSSAARHEWLDIVEARHALWTDVSPPKKELIRSVLNLLNLEIVKRARPSSVFNFEAASIGNMFLTGARIFTGSFESAIYLLSSICRVPEQISVLPAINTNFTHHICAGLADGTSITGQNSISHPSVPTALPPSAETNFELDEHDRIEDANWPGSLPTLRKQYISFSKVDEEELPARIERIWYINPYGQEIRLNANPKVVSSLETAECVIYSIGSLYTSIVPNLVLKGVGQALASPTLRYKILILNSSTDRETGPKFSPYTAFDFVTAIVRACVESQGDVYDAARPPSERKYVTHLIHLDGPGVPVVDKAIFQAVGIDTIRLYGRKGPKGAALRYDEMALTQTLQAIVGRISRSRRNTLEPMR